MEEINADEPEKIAVSLQNLEKLIRDEKLLDCPKDERFLMKFLHARKYDADKAFKTVQKYFRARQSYPAIFESFTPSEVLYDTIFRENKLLAVSSKRDSLGRAVMLVKTGAWDASICTLDEFTKACMILIEWMLFDEEVQKRGVVYILDYKGLGLHHLTQYTPFAIQKMIHIAQDCYPVRVKGVYVVNSPPVFDIFFSITKNFMKSKLIERVQLFGDDMEKLRDLVPDDVIPKEAGGTLESYDYDKLERDMLSQSDYFEELDRYGYGKESTRC
ncbi:alpha-tocopherol transfer protein-like isoform X1 [Dermacentor andersoni]|uniref:alpha-tocopherol transfer protein-like isoform X1 n=1 Tax=Dermacentor andersoni TaxID=34620 RepID=UPI003B3A40D1